MSHKLFNINNMPNIKEEKDIDIDHIVFLLYEITQITMVFFSANQNYNAIRSNCLSIARL